MHDEAQPIEIQAPTESKPWPHVECGLRFETPVSERNPQGGNLVQDETVPIRMCIGQWRTPMGMCPYYEKQNRKFLWCKHEEGDAE